MKRLLSILILMLALVCVFAACDADVLKGMEADDEKGTEGLAFLPLPDGTYGVSAGDALYLEDVVIPSKYKGKPVTQIVPDAFRNAPNLKTVTIPNSITTLGNFAFSNSGLVSVMFAEDSQLTTIGGYAFSYCQNLTSITLPDSVTETGKNAFYWCINLASVTLPEGVTEISEGSFHTCSSLTSITIPASVTKIGKGAFAGEGGLPSGLVSVNFAEGSQLTEIGESAFYYCDSLASIEIPASVTEIGEDAFSYCDSLASIEIPASVTEIGEDAFFCCSNLESATFSQTSGWVVMNSDDASKKITISATDLADPARAAEYLQRHSWTYNSYGYYWTRTAE